MRYALFFAKLALAALALGLLAQFVAWDDLVAAAREAQPGWALAALALLPLNVGLEALRWHRLAVKLDGTVTFRQSLEAVLSAYPLGLATPGRVGEIAGRALYLRRLRPGGVLAAMAGERMATVSWCLLGGLAALPLFMANEVELPAAAWIGVFAAAALGAGALVTLTLRPRLAFRVLYTLVPVQRFRRGLRVLGHFDDRDAEVMMGLSGLRYLVFSTQFWLMVRAFSPDLTLAAGFTAIALVYFAKAALPSFTLGELGIRETLAWFFFGAYGVAEGAAVNGALGLFAINIVLPALTGLPLMLRYRLRRADAAASPAGAA